MHVFPPPSPARFAPLQSFAGWEHQGTDLFAVTSSGTTPFTAACEGGRVEVVRSLMEKASAIDKLDDMCNVKDSAEKTAFDLAAAGQHKVRCTRCTAPTAETED